MGDTLESLQLKKESAAELQEVVSTMKALAAANIGQYEHAVAALQDYHNTILYGLKALVGRNQNMEIAHSGVSGTKRHKGVLVFGTDQGLAGNFNEILAAFAKKEIGIVDGKLEVWAVGSRMLYSLQDEGFVVNTLFDVPGSVNAITQFVTAVLMKIGQMPTNRLHEFYLVYNSPVHTGVYAPCILRILPVDGDVTNSVAKLSWPTNNIPEAPGNKQKTLTGLLDEYLFVTLYKACAESLSSENASRLAAMQRAEKNISDMLDDINQAYQRLRQNSIDEELFDVISGFEALKGKR